MKFISDPMEALALIKATGETPIDLSLCPPNQKPKGNVD
jgi:hypothetical protein